MFNFFRFWINFQSAWLILVSASVPLGLIWVLNWVALGWGWAKGGLGLSVWGQGLTIAILFNSRCLWDVTTRSNVSRVFCQWEMIVHICTESEQLKMKWNPGKFWRKCNFSDFLAKMGVFWAWKKSLPSWKHYLDFIFDWFIDSSR